MKKLILLITIINFTFSYGQVERQTDDGDLKLIQTYLITDKCIDKTGWDKRCCVNSEMNKLINKEFNWDLTEDLKPGNHSIIMMFKIDINGILSNIKIRSKNKALITEFERVLKIIPNNFRLINQDGKTVSGSFSIPLTISVMD